MYRILTLALIAALCFSSVLLTGCDNETPAEVTTTAAPGATTTAAPVDGVLRNPLTGEAGYSAELANSRYVGVMINNVPQARPQWGLCTPDIIFECETEGGITRMLWLYANPQELPSKFGSIRSARNFFVDIANGYNAIFVHWGGSDPAYQLINNLGLKTIDGKTIGEPYFFKVPASERDVATEHRGCSTGDYIRSYIEKNKIDTVRSSTEAPFAFYTSGAVKPAGGACTTITASHSSSYNHTFKYNAEDGLYYNYLNSNKMVDSEGKQMAVTNVIVLYTDISVMDAAGRVNVNLTSGKGVMATAGGYENITWKKGASGEMLKIFGADGNPVKLNTGKSWIGVVSSARESLTEIA